MEAWEIEEMIPGLMASGFQITSPESRIYNCIAWAVGYDNDWWSHLPGYYWPEWAPRSPEIEALVQVFAGLGYVICDNEEREEGYDKVALYDRDGLWQHAARQLEDGRWTSKLGPFEDITHSSPEDVAGEIFGEVHCIMRRPSR